MKMIRKHLWNKKRTETLKVADLQGYLAQFEPSAEVQLGDWSNERCLQWWHPAPDLGKLKICAN